MLISPLIGVEFSAPKTIAHFAPAISSRGDVLIIESENDDIIPHAPITGYVNAAKHAHSLTSRRFMARRTA